MDDPIVIAEYDPEWPKAFLLESERVHSFLSDRVKRIEHIGSTAVPGMPAKPVIDLLIGVESLERVRPEIPLLEEKGYAYWHEDTTPGRLFFVKGLPPRGPRTHHWHVVEMDSALWERVSFRDYLRANASEAATYVALKRRLAKEFENDREAYTHGKAEFIQAVMKKIGREAS